MVRNCRFPRFYGFRANPLVRSATRPLRDSRTSKPAEVILGSLAIERTVFCLGFYLKLFSKLLTATHHRNAQRNRTQGVIESVARKCDHFH